MSQNQNTNSRGGTSELSRSSRISVFIDIDTFLDATGIEDEEFNLREWFPELNADLRHDGGDL